MSETAVTPSHVPGWFGKMPNLGDFVSRRLPHEFIRGWDDWLQSGMAKARTEFGAEWPARYLVAPVRRFWLAPGLLGDTGWAGVLMPSVDGVGRYFPLTIAADVGGHDLAAVLAAGTWFRAIDAAGRKVLDVNFSADDLENELAQVAPLPVDAPGDDAEARRLAETWLAPDRAREISLWWCGDATQAAQFECFASLPPPAAFGSLLLAPE
jgi:type VI secretion system protein ImpM